MDDDPAAPFPDTPAVTRLPLAAAALVLLVACAAPPAPPLAPPPPPEPPPSATAAPAAPTAAPEAPPVSLGAPVDGRFTRVVTCKEGWVGTWGLGNGIVGNCGAGLQGSAFFHITPDGPPKLVPELFKELAFPKGRVGHDLGVTGLRGQDLDHLEVEIREANSSTGLTHVLRKTDKTWRPMGNTPFGYAKEFTSPSVRVKGRELAGQPDERIVGKPWGFYYLDRGPGWIPPQGRAPGCDVPVSKFTVLAVLGSHLWGIGTACGKLAAQRWTVGGAETAVVPLGLPVRSRPSATTPATISRLGDGWLYREGNTLAYFDGTTWKALEAPAPAETWFRSPEVLGKHVYSRYEDWLMRLEGSRWARIRAPAEIVWAAESSTGEVRIITRSAAYALTAEDTWRPVTLPSGHADLRAIDFLSGRWVVTAGKAGESHELFVEGASGPALDIADPPPAVSPMAYVEALGGSTCDAPFAMIHKLSQAAPPDYDYPATRKALKGRPDLAAGRFGEVKGLDDRYLVARYDGPRAAILLEDLVRVLEREVKGSKPQLLCADRVPSGLPAGREVSMK